LTVDTGHEGLVSVVDGSVAHGVLLGVVPLFADVCCGLAKLLK
jgi:hypothetical protein